MKYRLRENLPHEAATCLGWLLSSRGVEDIESYVNPTEANELDPFLLDNMQEGIDLLLNHLKQDHKILFVVDADCDGYTSSAILWLYIKRLYPNANLEFYCHEHKSHGLDDRYQELAHSSYDLIICPDSSSFDFDEHELLHSKGIDILVLDHHDAPSYSQNAVVINNQLSKNYPNKGLSGAGVVYKFCEALDVTLGVEYAHDYIDLCSIANIGDVMSFKHPETRYYVLEGLNHITNGALTEFIRGQSYSIFGTADGYLRGEPPTPINIAFYIVPLINSIVRVGTMDEKEKLFLAFIDPKKPIPSDKRGAKPGMTEPCASYIFRHASNARSRQTTIRDNAISALEAQIKKYNLLSHKLLVIEVPSSLQIPQELTGLLAQQFVTEYGRPCLIVRKNSDGYLSGSGRGNETFEEVPSLQEFLLKSECMDYVEGHANAHGASILPNKLNDLLNYADSNISDKGLENSYLVDYIFDADEYFEPLGKTIAMNDILWGNDINEPEIVVENIPLNANNIQVMGQNNDSVRFQYNGITYVKFKDSEFIEKLKEHPNYNITVYGKFNKNEYRGNVYTQVIIKDAEIISQDTLLDDF